MKVHLTRRMAGKALATCLASSALSVCLALTGCGGAQPSASTVAGLVSADNAVSSVSLKDSSVPPQERTSATDADGAFSFDVNGLTPPFLLSAVDAAGTHLSALAVTAGRTNIDALTTAASFVSADSLEEGEGARSSSYKSVLGRLRTVLAPLFDHYGVKFGDDWDESRAFRTMLREVSFSVASGSFTVTNKATGGVIYTAPLNNIASGVLHPENIPGGVQPTPPPPPPPATCTSFTYSAWGTCSAAGTQTRTVTASAPAGCTGGSPALTQTCTPPPPVLDGAALYASKCASCHGPLATSTKKGRTAAQITAAGMTMGLTAAEVQAVANALAVAPPPPPVACTSFTYSTWGACQANGTQTRTVLVASPAGCTGGSPVLTQTCTPPPPPPVTCTSFTYSAWTPAVCPTSGQQSRTVATSSPAGCTGGSPVLTQTCTPPPPPPVTCTSFTYSAWSTCSASGTQTRTVVSAAPAGCTGGTRILSQSCTPPPPAIDGAALYTQYCSGCHGNGKKGSSASTIQAAINGNTGGMGSAALRALTPAQIAAISAAP